MKPRHIERLVKHADDTKESIPRFLLMYVAWEAWQFRALVVACNSREWSVEIAEQVLNAAKISSSDNFLSRLNQLCEGEQRIKFKTDVRAVLKEIATLRHRLMHGVSYPNPRVADLYSDYLRSVLVGDVQCMEDGHNVPAFFENDKKDQKMKLRRLKKLNTTRSLVELCAVLGVPIASVEKAEQGRTSRSLKAARELVGLTPK